MSEASSLPATIIKTIKSKLEIQLSISISQTRNRLDFYSQSHPKGTPQLHSWWGEVKEFLPVLQSGWSWCLSFCQWRYLFYLLKEAKGQLSCYKAILEHKRQTNMFKFKKKINLVWHFHTPIILRGSMSCCRFSVGTANDQ